MSMQLIMEIQSEVQRLIFAGSELAAGDFRLKKLLPQIKKAGEGVPVFARVAEAMEKVVEPGDKQVSEVLLDLYNIVNAILYTQGKTGADGVLSDIDTAELDLPTDITFRRLKPIIEALTEKGSGRLEVLKEACDNGVFNDLRLVYPLVEELDDNYPDIALLVTEILKGFGKTIIPVLKNNFDFNGGKAHARRIDIIAETGGKDEKEFILKALEEGKAEVKTSAVKALKYFPECEPVLLDLTTDRKKEIREASLLSLAYLGSDTGVNRLFEVFYSKEGYAAVLPVKASNTKNISLRLVEEAEKVLEVILKSEKGSFSIFNKKEEPPSEEIINSFAVVLYCMEGKKDTEIFSFLKKCLEHTNHLQQFAVNITNGYEHENTLARMAARNMFAIGTNEAMELLDSFEGKYASCLIAYSFKAALLLRDSQYIFDHYSRYLRNGRNSYEGREILDIMESCTDFERFYRLYDPFDTGLRNSEYNCLKIDDIKWDSRWLRVLENLDELILVCRLASGNDAKCIKYLLKKLETNMSFNDKYIRVILKGLIQAQYPEILEVVLKVLEHNFKGTGHYMGYYLNDFIKIIQLLPPECAEGLEQFAAGYNNDAAMKLFEAARYIKNK